MSPNVAPKAFGGNFHGTKRPVELAGFLHRRIVGRRTADVKAISSVVMNFLAIHTDRLMIW